MSTHVSCVTRSRTHLSRGSKTRRTYHIAHREHSRVSRSKPAVHLSHGHVFSGREMRMGWGEGTRGVMLLNHLTGKSECTLRRETSGPPRCDVQQHGYVRADLVRVKGSSKLPTRPRKSTHVKIVLIVPDGLEERLKSSNIRALI